MIRDGRAGCRHIRPGEGQLLIIFHAIANAYHVESNDIAKRDLAGLVPLHEDAIDDLRTATGRKTENKWLLRRRVKRVDSAWFEVSSMRFRGVFSIGGIDGIHTNYIFGNILRDTQRVFTDDNSPVWSCQ